MSHIFLSAGGNFDKTAEIDILFIETVRNSGNLNILFIPTAKNTTINGYLECGEWLRKKLDLLGAQDITIILETDLNKCTQLEKYGAVYIGGGNTYKLQKMVRESGFAKRLANYIKFGGIVYGASAGAVIMGENIEIYQEENNIQYLEIDGMSLCGGYSLRCHYIEDQDETRIWAFIQKYKLPVIALPLGAAILVKDDKKNLIGNQNAFIFNLDHTITKLPTGCAF